MSSTSFNISEDIPKSHRQEKLLKSAGIISMATMISRILGYIRDMILAQIFGAEMVADAFFVAFKIPNLLRRLLGEGSLSASFIPVFTEYIEKRQKEEAWDLASNILCLTVTVTILLTILVILFAPLIILILAPGFYADKAKFDLTVLLTRILFPYIILISTVAISMGILNSLRHFAIPALTPAALNIGIILGAVWLAPKLKQPIIGVTLGVLIGGLMQLLMQAPILIKKGANLFINFSLKNKGTKRIGVLMLPAALGLGVTQINIMVDTLLASFLPEGSISYLYYSNRLLQLPLALFGIALGTALFPTFSSLASQGKTEDLMSTFSFGMRTVLFIIVPASIGLIVFRVPIINLLFQRGEFTQAATIATAQALFAYSVGLFAFAGLKITIPVFYAHQDTVTPVKIGIIAMLSNICLNLILMFPLKHVGLALATSLSSLINLVFLIKIMKNRWRMIDGKRIIRSSIKISFNSLFMGLICYWFMSYKFRIYSVPGQILTKIFYLLSGMVIGVIVYLIISYITKSKELDYFTAHFSKRKSIKDTLSNKF
ncbi:MAG: murein biosynthesis integral membrane protein MurJ [bacterium]